MEELVHDGIFTISTGASRKVKKWAEKQVTWSWIVNRLSKTKRTKETQAEYLKLSADRQSEIKDVGGFVGGKLKDGKRSASTVISRQLVTLDADFAEKDFWDVVKSKFDNAVCVYSTHKHNLEKPRLRLVIPLDRAVSPDEYQAISRKIAEKLGIDNFDAVTYRPSQLMYYPSTSSDAEFFFDLVDAEFLSADKVLAEYADWKDRSTWAVSSREAELINHEMKSAEDPLTKKGIIGAFCRAYTISEVIDEFLADVYEECGADRYKFKSSSSTGGAQVFEDKWLYSHHGTDPCNLRLCNAFDLVRIHKFGELDEGKENKETTSLPSYKKMLEFCTNDAKTKIEMTKSEFDVIEEDDSWRSNLQINAKTGKILSTRYNIRLILENDSRVKKRFGYDLFSQKIAILAPFPWSSKIEDRKFWSDQDDSELRGLLETYYGINGDNKIDDEILSVAHRNEFHRVREYLNGLKWDGVPRIDTFFIDYLGAANTDYVRMVTRKTLIAAVARIFKPGIKFDTVLVLKGPPGIGKSYLLDCLGKDWFSDSLSDMHSKDAYELLRGYWIMEISELKAVKKSDIESVKKFITKRVDSYRVSYGRHVQDFPRQCIFIGTTNDEIFLKDPTGNRRFLPVRVGLYEPTKKIFENPKRDAEIDQIWAEATAAWNAGESIWIGAAMEEVAKKVQEQHTEEIPQIGSIEEFLKKPIPADWYSWSMRRRIDYFQNDDGFAGDAKMINRERICTAEIWCELFGSPLQTLTPYEATKIATWLSKLKDWIPYENNGAKLSFGSKYGDQKCFVHKNSEYAKK